MIKKQDDKIDLQFRISSFKTEERTAGDRHPQSSFLSSSKASISNWYPYRGAVTRSEMKSLMRTPVLAQYLLVILDHSRQLGWFGPRPLLTMNSSIKCWLEERNGFTVKIEHTASEKMVRGKQKKRTRDQTHTKSPIVERWLDQKWNLERRLQCSQLLSSLPFSQTTKCRSLGYISVIWQPLVLW